MGRTFTIKVILARLSLVIVLFGCWILHNANLTDYVILAGVLIAYFGIFTFSDVAVTKNELLIKKNYFWGVFWFRKTLKYTDIISVNHREYEADLEDSNIWPVWFIWPSKLKWRNVRITYSENGIEKDVELKIPFEDFQKLFES